MIKQSITIMGIVIMMALIIMIIIIEITYRVIQ